jgi:hypothetical protein
MRPGYFVLSLGFGVVFGLLGRAWIGCSSPEPPTSQAPQVIVRQLSDEAESIEKMKVVVDERQAEPLCFYVHTGNGCAQAVSVPCSAVRGRGRQEIVQHGVLVKPDAGPAQGALPAEAPPTQQVP